MDHYNVLIIYNEDEGNRRFASEIAKVLALEGDYVSCSEINQFEDDYARIQDTASEADFVIHIISRWSVNNDALRMVLEAIYERKQPVISVVDESIQNYQSFFKFDYNHTNTVYLKANTSYEEVASRCLRKLFSLKRNKVKEKEVTETLKKGIKEYTEEVIEKLDVEKKTNRWLAVILYGMSAVVLATPIIVAILFLKKNNIVGMPLNKLITLGAVYCVLAILMVSVSKFVFTLAKSVMVESIRVSDRMHAISFGKFFVDVFDKEVTKEDVLKVFSAWNIDNGATSFREQTGDDYDPKLIEKILNVFDIAKKS